MGHVRTSALFFFFFLLLFLEFNQVGGWGVGDGRAGRRALTVTKSQGSWP